MVEYFANLLSKLVGSLGGILAAVLLLLLAFIVSAIVKDLVVKLLTKTRLREFEAGKLNPDGTPSGTSGMGIINYIGKVVYLLVFLMFVPGICTALGVSTVAAPISSLLTTVWGYLPNVLAASIVLLVGSLVARLVRELLVPVFKKINVDKLQEKAGIVVTEESSFSNTLAYIVYVLIMIPVVIVALQALKIEAVSAPAVSMLSIVLTFIPRIIVGLILIWIGTTIGKFTGQIVKKLIASSGADAKVKGLVGDKASKFVLSATVGVIVQIVLDIFFIVEGINVLGLAVLSNIGASVIAYLPSVLASVLILVAAFFLAAAVEKAMEKGGLKDSVVLARVAIYVVAVFMVLNQLGIASAIVNAAFIIILAAVAIAFAVSFGVGGRSFAAKQLEKLDKKLGESGKN